MVNENGAKAKGGGIVVRCCSPSWDPRHLPPEQRRFRRVHGLQLPLHPQQVAGWVLLIVVFIGTFTVLLATPLPLLLLLPPSPSPPPDLRLVLSLLFAVLFLLHLSTHLTVLLLDPADPEVRARPARAIVPEFDRARHLHVIENGRCHLCNITTRGPRTKHCSICNKCVPRFDHHCKWLNNCIGGRNYPAFLVCLASTLVVALAVTALSLAELVLLLTVPWDSGTKDGGTKMSNATTAMPPLSPVPGTGSLVLVVAIGILSAIAAVLLIHLCFFHGYIACLGLTTYEYVRSKRERGVTGTGATAAESRTTIHNRSAVTGSLCGIPYCTDCTAADGGEDVDGRMVVRRGLCSRFCDNDPLLDNGTNATRRTTTTDVYVCSTHEETARNGKDVPSKTLSSSIKGSRNFRLCFSYDSRTTETSIRVSSSQTTDAELNNYGVESPDTTKSSSTPSPVSCCFSIMNASRAANGSSRLHDGRHRRHSGESTKRSCGTMRRIQTFLQTRLRKGSRQRLTASSLSSSSSSSSSSSAAAAAVIARHCGNKIIPQQAASPPEPIARGALTAENRNHGGGLVEAIMTELTTEDYPRPPARLPALNLSRENVRKTRKVSSNATDISVLGQMPSSAIPKRNQVHLRTRRTASFSKKRPRFKVGSHVVSQTAQLSPIPESEFSKPATPRSPLRSGSIFAFPPLHE